MRLLRIRRILGIKCGHERYCEMMFFLIIAKSSSERPT
jgi:hypothetical protein